MPLYIQIHLFSKTLALCTVGSRDDAPIPTSQRHLVQSNGSIHWPNLQRKPGTTPTPGEHAKLVSKGLLAEPGLKPGTQPMLPTKHSPCILHTVNLFIVSLQFHPPPSPQQWLQLLLYAWHESASGHLSHFNFNMYHASEISDGACDHVTEFRLVHADCTWSRQTADNERGEGRLSDARM